MPSIDVLAQQMTLGKARVPHDFHERFQSIRKKSVMQADRLTSDPNFERQEIARYRKEAGTLFDSTNTRALRRKFKSSPNYRTLYNEALAPYADALVKRALQARLREHSESDRVVFLAGGAASGKTMITQNLLRSSCRAPHAIFDSTSKSFASTHKLIDTALECGKSIDLYFVYRPFARAVASSILRALQSDRSINSGKTVSVSTLVSGHYYAPRTLRALHERYGKEQHVRFSIIENDGSFSAYKTARSLQPGELDGFVAGTRRSMFAQARKITKTVLAANRDSPRHDIVKAGIAVADANAPLIA